MSPRLGRLGEAGVVALLLALAGLLFARSLDTATTYDEGVYLASLDSLRDGQTLGSEVFASQPPGFYVLLRLIGLFSGHSVTDARVGFLLVALLGCLGAYALGRALSGIAAGVAAAALLAILPPFPAEAIRVDADVPAVSLALVALALAAVGRRRQAPLAVLALAGAVLALAVSVKLFALVAIVPLVGLLAGSRAPRRAGVAALAGAGVVAVAFVIAYAGVLGPLWRGVVQFHREARSFPSPRPNGEVLRHFLEFRTPSAWLVLLGLAATVLAWRRAWPLWLWVAATIGFLLWQKPLFDHHLVLLCAALASAAGVALGGAVEAGSAAGKAGDARPVNRGACGAPGRLPRRASLSAATVLVAALAVGGAQQAHRLGLRVTSEPQELRWATALLRSCAGAVASDQPIAAFRAQRPLPGQLVDTSLVRLSTPSLRPRRLLSILDRQDIVGVFAGRAFLRQPVVLAALTRRYGPPRRFGSGRFYARAGACRGSGTVR